MQCLALGIATQLNEVGISVFTKCVQTYIAAITLLLPQSMVRAPKPLISAENSIIANANVAAGAMFNTRHSHSALGGWY